jgi:hypothetical protein
MKEWTDNQGLKKKYVATDAGNGFQKRRKLCSYEDFFVSLYFDMTKLTEKLLVYTTLHQLH